MAIVFDNLIIYTTESAKSLEDALEWFSGIYGNSSSKYDHSDDPAVTVSMRITGYARNDEVIGYKTMSSYSKWHLDVTIADHGAGRQIIICAFGDRQNINGEYLPLSKKRRASLLDLMLN